MIAMTELLITSKVQKHISNKKGFTFIEILLAIFIIGVGAIPVLTMFHSGTKAVEKGGVIFQVAVGAQAIMDTVRSDTFLWEGLPVKLTIPSDKDRGLKLPQELITKYKATAELSVDNAPGYTVNDTGEPESNLYRVDLVIKWVEDGANCEYRLMNYRANTNVHNVKTSTRFE